MKKSVLAIGILAILLALYMLLVSCQKQSYNNKTKYVETIKASFYELDTTESVVVKQFDPGMNLLAEQEFKVTSLDFQADMVVKNQVPSLFVMYLKDQQGNLTVLETRPLR